ncbi:putative serine/threonine-protein kinase pats1 [Stylophora pistillata]|uniref:Putative serine/threonine-protein kinase pats1 n=2 Tax=Stylophora pistillata TaxID=50429 RepID=A0A2B4R941_STYPI|nr:putative serine/threonine-protein kinase pats1 [Stylophora pistillata]
MKNVVMACDIQGIRLTDDHTLETASEVMSQLEFDRRLPNGRDSYLQVLKKLDFRSEQDGGEWNKLEVFQGQCLILGDARVGKTSLKKSLTGVPFDADEPGTTGVEMALVDRKWRPLHADNGLKFGNFERFWKSVVYKTVMFGPAGVHMIIDKTVATTFPSLLSLSRLVWMISIVWLLAFSAMSFSYCVFSAAIISMDCALQVFLSERPEALTFALSLSNLPRALIGIITMYLLAGIIGGIDCQELDSSPVFVTSPFSANQFIWALHLTIVAVMIFRISNYLSCLIMKYFESHTARIADKSPLPGQTKFNTAPQLAALLLLIIPVMSGLAIGAISWLQLHALANTTTLHYCQVLHSTLIPTACLVILRVALALILKVKLESITSIIIFYIITGNIYAQCTHFCSVGTYLTIFVGIACYILYNDWNTIFFLFSGNEDSRVKYASFTFVIFEKVVLNFKKLRKALQSMFSSLKLRVLDFSGDEEYYAYHHIFMRDNAIYLVVFNMANFANDHFGNMAAKVKRLQFWLESICSKASAKTPIFLVGTHRGNMEKSCFKKINKHLRKNLWNSFSDELVLNKEEDLLYYPVENTSGNNDTGIQNLQRQIIAEAEKCKMTIGRKIPFSWIKIQDAIINLRQSKNAEFCIKLAQFPKVVATVCNFFCSNWSKETLKYFHEKGLVVYIDHAELSEWVLLKPQILTNIISQLVTPLKKEAGTEQRGFRQDSKLLHDTGMLTEPLLKHVLSRCKENEVVMKSFLEEYDIICPLFHNRENNNMAETVTHFVPSLLPLSDVNTPVWQDSPKDKVFYAVFKRFLPQALFQHLLSRAHRSSKVEFPEGEPLICKNVGRFWWRPCTAYRLSHLKEFHMIEVTFTYREDQEIKPSVALSQVYTMIEDICKRHFPHVKFHCGPACPSGKCPKLQEDYIKHPGVQRSHYRRHVFNVMPARKDQSTSSFYCVNQNFEEDLTEWEV